MPICSTTQLGSSTAHVIYVAKNVAMHKISQRTPKIKILATRIDICIYPPSNLTVSVQN